MTDFNIAKYNDIQILEIINSFRFIPLQVLTSILMERKFYSSYQAVSRAVLRMKDKGLIRTIYYTNNAKIIFLSKLGSKALAQGMGVDEENINCPERLTWVNYFALEHTVKVANLYLLILRECQKHNITINSFKGDHFTRYEYQFRAVSSGKNIKRYVMPDAELSIEINGRTGYTIWIEYDRGTEYSQDVAVKYMKYFEHYDQIIEKQNWYPIILFITENTKQRLNNLVVKDENYDGEWEWNNSNKSYKNVVLKGVSMADNIRNMNSNATRFLSNPNRFLFVDFASFKDKGFTSDLLNLNAELVKLIDVLKVKTK